MTDYTSRINAAKAAVEKAKADRIRAEQNKENLLKRQAEIEAEIRALGVEPDQLDETIAKLEAEIQADLLTVEQMIPAQYR
jgi:chromosome segregation ATPase